MAVQGKGPAVLGLLCPFTAPQIRPACCGPTGAEGDFGAGLGSKGAIAHHSCLLERVMLRDYPGLLCSCWEVLYY